MADQFKCGNEFLPYHPSASHVDPRYRDGWNACFKAAREELARTERNRDMWKGQCERQAIQLEALRMTDGRRKDLLAAALYITARDDDTAILNCTDAERIAELLLDMSGVDIEAAIKALGGKGAA